VKPIAEKILEYYQTEEGALPFKEWQDSLRDLKARVDIDKRLRQVTLGTLGEHRSVGEGVVELKFKKKGPGYRIYIGQHGTKLIILLCGGDKSSQSKDIKTAHGYWTDWKRRNK
jgi:putative addiction module killer protein